MGGKIRKYFVLVVGKFVFRSDGKKFKEEFVFFFNWFKFGKSEVLCFEFCCL